MTPDFLIQALSIQDIPPLENAADEAVMKEICQDLMNPVVALLKAEGKILYQDQSTTREETNALRLEIGAKLCETLLPTFAEELGTVGPRLAKLVFDELKDRGFEDKALEHLVSGLMQALEPSLLVEDLEEDPYNSDYSYDDNSDMDEDVKEK